MADRITNDMMSMAKSYNTDSDQKPLMQDKPTPSAYTKPAKNAGHVGSVGDFASKGAADVESVSALSPHVPKESKNEGENKPLVGAVSTGNEADAAQHSELMQSQRDQNKNLSSIDQSVSAVSSLMHKEAYGPKLDTYERDTEGESVHALAKQLAEQHAETQKALKEIRNAIFGMDGGLLGGLGGGLGFGGGGDRNKKKDKSRTRTRTRNTPRVRGGGGWRGKLVQGALTLGAGLFVGNQIMGGSDSPSETFEQNNTTGKTDTWAGLGSISASNESNNGVRTVSSGRGDHGGVSYGTHQLASETGSMAKFLQSEEGAAFAPAFANMEPGTEQFNRRYSAVADEYEVEFAQAQSNYIKRTHYEPMVDTVKAGTGADLSKRGPAVQEMLYSTGVQYGPNSSVITKALKDKDVSSMSDEQIINTVQEYKINTTEQYFKSSSKQVRDSVMRRAGTERGQLIALNRQYENGEIDTGQSQSVPSPMLSTGAMVGASMLGTGAYVMSQRPVDQPKITASTADIKDVAGKPTTVRNVAAAANDSVVPKKSFVPKSVRSATASAASKVPDSVKAAGRTTVKGATTAGKALRKVPVLGAGLTALDAYSTVTDDSLTTGEKAGALTDMGGGLVVATVGAKGGALAGAAIGSVVPVVGTAIGGLVGGLVGGTAGYFAGEGITKSAREWVGGLWGDDEEEEENVRTSGAAIEGYDNYDAVYDPSVSQVTPSPISATDASALAPLTPLDKTKGLSPLKPLTRPSSTPTVNIAGRTSLSGRAPSQPSGVLSDPKVVTPAKGKKESSPTGAIAGAIKALASASVIGTAVSAASVAKDYVSRGTSESENVLDPDFQSKAMAVAAAPVVGAVKGATALYEKFAKSETVGTSTPKPANAQEIFDAASVGPVSGKNVIKPASSKGDSDEDDSAVSAIYSGIISSVFGSEVAQKIKEGGPVASPFPARKDVPRTTGPRPIDHESLSSTSVSQVGQKQAQPKTSSAANITTQAVKETPSSRSQYGSVQKVIVVDQTVKKVADKKKLGAPPRTPSAGAFESRSIKPSIDETPAIITDFGLTLLNTGFI